MTSKLHGFCDSKGGLLQLHLSEGQAVTSLALMRLNRRRHKIENLFSRLKDWRPLATRYDRLAHIFRSAILLAANVLFW